MFTVFRRYFPSVDAHNKDIEFSTRLFLQWVRAEMEDLERSVGILSRAEVRSTNC